MFPANVQSQGLQIICVPSTLFFFPLKNLYIYMQGDLCVCMHMHLAVSLGAVDNKSKADFIYNLSCSMWKADSSER